MAENSKIEWTHHTFNPVLGCQKVGAGCDNCYAEGWAKRSGLVKWGAGEARRVTSDAYWRQPLKWDREAAAAGERRRVFCASLADVFDNAWPPEIRERLFALIKATTHLDWLLLTKRPGNIARMLPPDWGRGYPNVWLGCTVVNQAEADRDIPKLMAVPARVRFLSMEPLLGPVDLLKVGGWFPCYLDEYGHGDEYLTALNIPTVRNQTRSQIHLVIVGGESGPGARPMHPDWPRGLRDQCVAAGVSFFFKQWGEWGPAIGKSVTHRWHDEALRPFHGGQVDGPGMARLGKARAGRLLDGREWNQMPGVA